MRLIIVDAFLERERQIQSGTVGAQLDVFEQYRVPRVDYCILSHRWTGNEVTYEEMRKLTKVDSRDEIRSRAGYQKVLRSCEQAKRDDFKLLWVDTCCIDLLNGPETSDAINSMFQWYQKSKRCYAYLHDISVFPARRDETFARFNGWPEWFSRGWTLQELVAPRDLQFFNKDWVGIGDKQSLAPKLAEITKVPLCILRDGLSSYRPSVAQVISWAADRNTTRAEDRAYSLLGLLGVSMPTLYGEEKGAFLRLQLEIMRTSNDQSIFAWKDSTTCDARWSSGVLADDPSCFRDCHDVIKMEPKEFCKGLLLLWESDAKEPAMASQEDDGIPAFTVTSGAIRIRLPLLPYYGCPSGLPGGIGMSYSGATGPLQLFPQYRQLCLAYREERPREVTFKIDDRTVPYYGFTRRDVFPDVDEVSFAGNSFTVSNTSPLAIVRYTNSAIDVSFAIAFGCCFCQDWVHVICDEQATDVEKVHRVVWNAGAEYARVMAEVRFGERGRPHYVKHEPLPRTMWTVRVFCGGLEESSDRRVTVDVVPLPGGYWKTLGWEPVYVSDIEDSVDMPCPMKKTSWIGDRFDSHTLLVDSIPKVFDLAHALQEVELGDYGITTSNDNGIGYFERRGNIFDDLKLLAHELGIDLNDPGLMPVVQAVHSVQEGGADTISKDVTTKLIKHEGDRWAIAGLTLRQPRSLSLPNTQPILMLLKQLSARNRNHSLVTTVVQCSACYPTDDFKQRINSAMLQYPKFSHNSTTSDLFNVSVNLHTITPLYCASNPWIWCRCELDNEVVNEYRRIREQFSITQDHPLQYGEEPREPGLQLFKRMFGVEHLTSVVGDITFFEQLATSLSTGKELGTTRSKGNMPSGSRKPCVKKLVMTLLRAMKGVTQAFQMRQSPTVVEMMYKTRPIAATLGAEFLVDISATFLGTREAFEDVDSEDGPERNSCETDKTNIQLLVNEVTALQLQYLKSKDDDERLVLEQDIIGTILLACRYGISLEVRQRILEIIDGVLGHEATDISMPLPEREERVNCLRSIGDIFEDANS
ncbi:hypothetical protein F5141DRAFT_1293411 [Pisolithus sp. B1]|nr:hypothetical protein F5141DRAFT_1293411 [Pisolithus sp. B1]